MIWKTAGAWSLMFVLAFVVASPCQAAVAAVKRLTSMWWWTAAPSARKTFCPQPMSKKFWPS